MQIWLLNRIKEDGIGKTQCRIRGVNKIICFYFFLLNFSDLKSMTVMSYCLVCLTRTVTYTCKQKRAHASQIMHKLNCIGAEINYKSIPQLHKLQLSVIATSMRELYALETSHCPLSVYK